MNSQQYLWPAFRRRLLHSNRPILVGPFIGEVGLEVLYWLSFLQTLKQAGVKPERMIPIARGGAACWYGTPTGIELYAMRTLQDVRVENIVRARTTGMVKQRDVTPFDRAVVADVAKTLGLKKYHVLHPLWMYRTLEPYWYGHRGLDWLVSRAQYDFIPPPPLPAGLTLPESFLAVKFYFRPTFQHTQPALDLAKYAIAQLAEQQPVIVLNTGIHADDHIDLPFTPRPNVLQLRDLTTLTPETSLAVQSAVMARAMGFVGTYGGLAHLAQRLGRPAVSFYTVWGGTSLSHKHLSDAIALRSGVPFCVQSIKELPILRSVIPDVRVGLPLTMASNLRQSGSTVADPAAGENRALSVEAGPQMLAASADLVSI